MKKCYIRVQEKETIHLWSKYPRDEYGNCFNTTDNPCVILPKNISKYFLKNIADECDYKTEEVFEVDFKKVDTKSYLDTNIDSDISTELNNTEFILKEVDFDYINKISDFSPIMATCENDIFYSLSSKGCVDFIIKVQKDVVNNEYINLNVFEISGRSFDTKEPRLDWRNEYLKAYIRFNGSFHFVLGEPSDEEYGGGYVLLNSNYFPKHIVLMSEIYKLAKLHITDFMGADK